jgi:hypothetical protein
MTMLQGRKRFPFIEMPVESDEEYGLTISCEPEYLFYKKIIQNDEGKNVTEERENLLRYINEIDLFKAYGEIRNLLFDDEGYPVFLNIDYGDNVSDSLPLRHRFVPYRDYCLRLHNIHGVTFVFSDLNGYRLYFHEGDTSHKKHWFDFINTAKWCKICTVYIPSSLDKEVCSFCDPDTSAINSIFVYPSEWTFYRALVELHHPNLLVFPKIGLKDILDLETLQHRDRNLSQREISYFYKAHIDFVLVEAVNFRPIAAIEIDGPSHDEPSQRQKDKMKNRFCNLGDLPL